MPIPGRDSNPVRADSCSFRTKAHIQAGADWASTGTCSRRDIGKDRRGQRKSQGTPGSSNCSPRTFLGQAVVDQATRVEATRREKCFESGGCRVAASFSSRGAGIRRNAHSQFCAYKARGPAGEDRGFPTFIVISDALKGQLLRGCKRPCRSDCCCASAKALAVFSHKGLPNKSTTTKATSMPKSVLRQCWYSNLRALETCVQSRRGRQALHA